ncbi:MAG: HEPN domain protein [Candidatus Magnetoglobus multicellularis str. Araruama]|uniref:HEPN domain protein n=1 Tax=Candidatus Magnetoglobus multicellularis str. Araruama TaxID=890399 RepID=A0A1V1NSD7_9BACT|nr:MAG: HEPN domain protein [Candidatus Magnetoglobus multicellularis str. Araruama]
MSNEYKALIQYRIEQANESLDSAEILFKNEKYRPSVNRSYYAMFYAILALIIPTEHKTSKHSGAISIFNKEYVKTGIFDKDFSRWLREAFDMRQRADYQELFIISRERASDILNNAKKFVNGISRELEK